MTTRIQKHRHLFMQGAQGCARATSDKNKGTAQPPHRGMATPDGASAD
jgi:hypothetical protein